MKDQRLEAVLYVVRTIDADLERMAQYMDKLVALRGALMALDEHGIGFPGSPSYEDGPEVER